MSGIMGIFQNIGKDKELEEILKSLEANLSNNYKDNARDNLVMLEKKYDELKNAGKLNDKKIAHYSSVISEYKEKMKNYTHKDQKPYWT